MNKKSLGICVIGTGRAGLIHANNFVKNIKHAELVALVDPNKSSLAIAGKDLGIVNLYADYKEAIISNEDVDAVVIATPTHFHRDIALFAAGHGKHILCEKPMAMDVRECEDMIKAG